MQKVKSSERSGANPVGTPGLNTQPKDFDLGISNFKFLRKNHLKLKVSFGNLREAFFLGISAISSTKSKRLISFAKFRFIFLLYLINLYLWPKLPYIRSIYKVILPKGDTT